MMWGWIVPWAVNPILPSVHLKKIAQWENACFNHMMLICHISPSSYVSDI